MIKIPLREIGTRPSAQPLVTIEIAAILPTGDVGIWEIPIWAWESICKTGYMEINEEEKDTDT